MKKIILFSLSLLFSVLAFAETAKEVPTEIKNVNYGLEKIFEGGAFTIVEKNKEGTWGKLLSGIGWINISSDYVNIVK